MPKVYGSLSFTVHSMANWKKGTQSPSKSMGCQKRDLAFCSMEWLLCVAVVITKYVVNIKPSVGSIGHRCQLKSLLLCPMERRKRSLSSWLFHLCLNRKTTLRAHPTLSSRALSTHCSSSAPFSPHINNVQKWPLLLLLVQGIRKKISTLFSCRPIRISPSPTTISAPSEQFSYTAKTTEISKQIFPEKEYRGLSPNFHIYASVSDLYIPTIGLPILLEEICLQILGLYKSLTDTWMWKLGLRPRYSQKRNT